MNAELLKIKLNTLKSCKDDLQDLWDKLDDMESDANGICSPDISDHLNSEDSDDEDVINALNNVDDVREEVETAVDNAKDAVSNAMEELDERIEELEEELEKLEDFDPLAE